MGPAMIAEQSTTRRPVADRARRQPEPGGAGRPRVPVVCMAPPWYQRRAARGQAARRAAPGAPPRGPGGGGATPMLCSGRWRSSPTSSPGRAPARACSRTAAAATTTTTTAPGAAGKPTAPPDVRRLYVLKQLTGRQGWAGRTVHSAVELVLRALHAGEELSEERLIEDTVGRMREEWRFSRRGRLSGAAEGGRRPLRARVRRRGVGPGVAGPPGPRRAGVSATSTGCRSSPTSGARRAERWILIEDVRAFEFEGTPIYAAPDFGYWTRDDRLALVDWKTGSPDPGGDRGPAGRLRALRPRHPGRAAGPRGSPGGEPPRGRGHRAPLGCRAARRDPRAASASRSAA